MSETVQECSYCDGKTTHENHYVCPKCEQSGFDGQGEFMHGGVLMYKKRCWNCGHIFATEMSNE